MINNIDKLQQLLKNLSKYKSLSRKQKYTLISKIQKISSQILNQFSANKSNKTNNANQYCIICNHINGTKIWSLCVKNHNNSFKINSFVPEEIEKVYPKCLFSNQQANKICMKNSHYHKVNAKNLMKLIAES